MACMVRTGEQRRARRGGRCCTHEILGPHEDAEMNVGYDAPIDVLLGAHGLGDEALALRGNMLTERKLDEDAADFCIVVEVFDCCDNLIDGAGGGQSNVVKFNADLLRGLCFHTDIDRGIRAFASLYDGELGLKTRVFRLERANASRDAIAD